MGFIKSAYKHQYFKNNFELVQVLFIFTAYLE